MTISTIGTVVAVAGLLNSVAVFSVLPYALFKAAKAQNKDVAKAVFLYVAALISAHPALILAVLCYNILSDSTWYYALASLLLATFTSYVLLCSFTFKGMRNDG